MNRIILKSRLRQKTTEKNMIIISDSVLGPSYRTFAKNIWAASSEFVSSSIPSWQILTAHAQPFRVARDLAFCLKVPLDSLPVWASSRGSGETARMRRLAWTFAARIGDKYQIRLTRSILLFCHHRGTELPYMKQSNTYGPSNVLEIFAVHRIPMKVWIWTNYPE